MRLWRRKIRGSYTGLNRDEKETGVQQLYLRPFMQLMLSGEEVSMKEVRDFLESWLAEKDTFSLCANCSVSCSKNESATIERSCCYGCPNLDLETGCTVRNAACLLWACGDFRDYIEKKKAYAELIAMRAVFERLDGYRGARRIPDHVMIKLVHNGYMRSSWFEAEPVSGTVSEARITMWTHKDELAANKRHREAARARERQTLLTIAGT